MTVEKFLSENILKRQLIYSVLISILLFLGIIFRENGWSLFFILLICQIVKVIGLIKDKKEIKLSMTLLYLMPYVIATAAYHILSMKYPIYYQTSVFNFIPDSIIRMIIYYFIQFRIEFFNCSNILSYIFCIWTILLFIYGIIKNYKKEYVALIVVITFIGYLICPIEQGVRYIIPLIPFVFIFVGLGISKIKNLNIKQINICFLVILCILNLLILNRMNIGSRLLNKNLNYGIANTLSLDMYKYIKENIPQDKKIIYWHPRAIYLYTGRLSFQIGGKKEKLREGDYQVSIIGTEGPGSFYDKEMYDIREKTYIPEADIYLLPIYRNGNYAVYKIEKGGKQ